jgi:hypothetical protein
LPIPARRPAASGAAMSGFLRILTLILVLWAVDALMFKGVYFGAFFRMLTEMTKNF